MLQTKNRSTLRVRIVLFAFFVLGVCGALNQVTAQSAAGTDRNPGGIKLGITSDPDQKIEFKSSVTIRSRGFFLNNPQRTRAGYGKQMMLWSLPPFAEIVLGTGNAGDYLVLKAGGTERMRVDTNGNVGIGTTSPGSILDIQSAEPRLNIQATTGAARAFQTFNNTGGQAYFGLDNSSGNGMFSSGGAAYSLSMIGAGTNPIKFGHTNAEVTILSGGNVGIGTTSPDSQLHVSGGTAMTSGWNRTANLQATYPTLVFNSASSKWAGIGYDYSSAFRIWVNASSNDVSGTGNPVFNILNSGNVGIGATSPDSPIHVSGGTAMTSGWNRTANLQATFPTLVFNSASSKWAGIGYDYSSAFRIWVNAASNDVSGSGNPALNILNSGDVGIGTTNPQATLHVQGAAKVTGNLTVDGNISAKYQDVAEWVESSEQLAAGTVVVLDST
ncbi:MAG: hypothetical protein ACRDRT_08870, partial [Pseudonocardiaceae bacterium]